MAKPNFNFGKRPAAPSAPVATPATPAKPAPEQQSELTRALNTISKPGFGESKPAEAKPEPNPEPTPAPQPASTPRVNPFAAAASKPNPGLATTSATATKREQRAQRIVDTHEATPTISDRETQSILEEFLASNPLPDSPTPADILTHNLAKLDLIYESVTLGRDTLREIHATLAANPDLKEILTPQSFASITQAMASLTSSARKREAKTAAKAPAKRVAKTEKSEAISDIAALGISL